MPWMAPAYATSSGQTCVMLSVSCCPRFRPVRNAHPAHVHAWLVPVICHEIGCLFGPRRAPGCGRITHRFELVICTRRSAHSLAAGNMDGTKRDDKPRCCATPDGLSRPANGAEFERQLVRTGDAVSRRPCRRPAHLGTARLRPTVPCPLLTRPSRTLRAASRCPDGPP